MSDYNNDHNDYTEYSSEGSYEFYSDGDNYMPKKPSKHTGLKVAAILLILGVIGASGYQVYNIMGDILKTPETVIEEPSNGKNEVSKKPVSTGRPARPAGEELPGLFELASRTDSKHIPDIVDEIMPYVVGISSTFEYTQNVTTWGWGGFGTEPQTYQSVGTGTGIVSTSDGYIITNAHVIYSEKLYEQNRAVGEAKTVSVLFSDDSEYDAKIVAYDVETDLAVLKIDQTGLTPAIFGDSSELRVGELVIAVGNPLGFELFGSVTSGIVSALNRQISVNEKDMTLIQTDAAINAGNSGGPLLNSCGQVIGINSVKMSSRYGTDEASIEGLGFAIPINEAKTIVDDLINYKHVTGRPQLGINGENVTEALSNYLGIPMGIYVRTVNKGSSADYAGIRPGDIIIGINDEPVTTSSELNKIKNTFKAGDMITLKISRNGEDIDVDLVLDEATDNFGRVTEE